MNKSDQRFDKKNPIDSFCIKNGSFYVQSPTSHQISLINEVEKNKLADASILLTGCGGFLGYYFMHFLSKYIEAQTV